jgi:hypothetical protein
MIMLAVGTVETRSMLSRSLYTRAEHTIFDVTHTVAETALGTTYSRKLHITDEGNTYSDQLIRKVQEEGADVTV